MAAGGNAGGGGAPPCVFPGGTQDNTVGAVIPNLLWQGYVNDDAAGLSTGQPYVPYGTEGLFCESAGTYALVHTVWAL